MSEPRSFMALGWVKEEIEGTLDRARDALEAYAKNPDDVTLVRQCLTSLHQVNGTLQMVELTGAAVLAGEMEALAQALMNRSVVDDERAQEALIEGILQLPSHLNRVRRGAEDDARVHTLLINRMRLARGEEAFSQPGELAVDPAVIAEFLAGRGRLEARKVRAACQKAMVALLRGAQPTDKAYRFLDKAFTRLEQLVPASPLQNLWAVAAGAMEASQVAGEDSSTVLPLLRGLDQQLKDLVQATEATLAAEPPAKLLDGLKALVEASLHDSPRLAALRERLAGATELAPVQPVGADDETIAMVATALHEELGSVRDRLDLFVRGSASDADGLASLGADLQRVVSTLQVAGLEELRKIIGEQAAWLRLQVDATEVDEESIMEVASAVLFVDSELMRLAGIDSEDGGRVPGSLSDAQTAALEEARASLGVVKQGITDFIASDWEHSHLEAVLDTLAGVRSVLELVPLERVATLVEQARQYVGGEILQPLLVPDWQCLDHLADAISGMDYYLERFIEDCVPPDSRLLEIAEESIALLRAGDATGTASMPNEAPAQLPEGESAAAPDDLATEAPAVREATTVSSSSMVVPAELVSDLDTGFEPAIERDALDVTVVRPSGEMAAVERDEQAPSADETIEFEPETFVESASPNEDASLDVEDEQTLFDVSTAVLAVVKPEAAEEASCLIDEEILDIFLGEVVEVLENMDEALAQWRARSDDSKALGEIRRAWHTLKGSGRMVGASLIGDLSWSVENMLNRVIDGTISASPPVIELTEAVRGLIPELSEALAAQREPAVDVALWIERADVFASGGSAEDLEGVPLPIASSASAYFGAPADDEASALSVPVEEDCELDDEFEVGEAPAEPEEASLFDIFEQEVEEHIAMIRAFLDEARTRHGGVPLSEALRRGLHTIKGSAAMANWPGISALAAPLESIFRGYLDLQRDADAELSAIIEHGLGRIEAGLDALRGSGREASLGAADQVYFDAAKALLDRLETERGDRDAGGESRSPRAIFSSENVGLLLDAALVLGEWARAGVTVRVEALRFELRDLSERARGAGQNGIAALADALREAHDRLGQTLPEEARAVLERAYDVLVTTLDALAADLDVPPVEASIAELHTLKVAPEPIALAGVQGAATRVSESIACLDLDAEMVELFFEEAEEILEVVETSLDRWPNGEAGAADELMRALHTLKGGARMAGLVGLGDEAHDLETWIGEHDATAPDDGFFTALRERADVMAEHIAMLRRGETVVREVPADEYEMIAAAVPATPALVEEIVAAPPPLEPEQVVTPMPGLEPASPAKLPAIAVSNDDLVDTDPEILALFREEAAELTEMLDGSLQGWRSEPANEIHMENVLRALHTLKGSARMAGLMDLGEYVHHFETRIINRGSSGEPMDIAFLGGVQNEMDVLSEQIAGLESASGIAPLAGSAATEPVAETPLVQEFAAEARAATMTAPAQAVPQEMIRVSAGLLDELVNLAGETSIMRGRVQQQISDFDASLDELSVTIERIRGQVRRLDSEAQEQVVSRQEAAQRAERAGYEDFDPLEMDRYTQLQELTRTLAESASDISDLRDTLTERIRDTDTLLSQQGRINTELQEGLMRTRMVPFTRLLPRLNRIVRQVGRELGKLADLMVENAEGELDRNVLERMIAPLEHMLRNAVDHGLESPQKRAELGKPPRGTIRLRLDRDGGDILIQVSDDGSGINVAGVRVKAVERGLLEPDAAVSDAEILSFVMAPGFSTANSVTQVSGRGVGMDVVNSEVKQLGGTISIASQLGAGTTFTVRLPLTVSVNRALMVHVGSDVLAVPMRCIEGIVRVSPAQLISKYGSSAGTGANFSYAGREYALSYLGEWLGCPRQVIEDVPSVPILMVRSGSLARAVHVDAISGSREIVVKSLGAQFAGVGGISGATIMGDGSVVVILDLPALLRSSGTTSDPQEASAEVRAPEAEPDPIHVMVVDDSVTVRKVTTRLLERRGYRVTIAKDGVEAVAALADEKPDIMLLDIEMPRMDGFEVATHVRNETELHDLPIIMITSRTSEKHRERAESIGVNCFLGKPFQEPELFAEIESLIG